MKLPFKYRIINSVITKTNNKNFPFMLNITYVDSLLRWYKPITVTYYGGINDWKELQTQKTVNKSINKELNSIVEKYLEEV